MPSKQAEARKKRLFQELKRDAPELARLVLQNVLTYRIARLLQVSGYCKIKQVENLLPRDLRMLPGWGPASIDLVMKAQAYMRE